MNQNSNDLTSKINFPGLPQPLIGAMIGIFVFLILLLIMRLTESRLLMAALLSAGYLVLMVTMFSTDLVSNMSSLGYKIFLFSISSIPFAILGSLIASKEKAIKTTGVKLLVIYFVVSIVAGLLVLVAWSD